MNPQDGPWLDYAPTQQPPAPAPQAQPVAQPEATPAQAAPTGPWTDYAGGGMVAAPTAPQPVQTAPLAPVPGYKNVDASGYAVKANQYPDAVLAQHFAPPPTRPQTPGLDVTPGDYISQELDRGFAQPWHRLSTDLGDAIGATPQQRAAESRAMPLWQHAVPLSDPAGQRGLKVLGDLGAVALSPFDTATHALITRPAAAAATGTGLGDQATNEGIVDFALQGLPARKGVPRVPSKLAPEISLLTGEGVPLTPGMSRPGFIRKAEDVLGKVPVVGAKVGAAQQQAVQGLNVAAGNRVLAPLNKVIPSTVKPGRDMIGHLQQTISDAYGEALPNLTVTRDPQFVAGTRAAVASPRFLAPQDGKYLNGVANQLHQALASGPLDGQSWKSIDSQLGKVAADNHGNTPLAEGLRGLQDQWRQLAYRSDSAAAGQVADADAAHARFQVVKRASTYKNPEEPGVFTPSQLDSAVKAEDWGGKTAYAQGQAPFQDLSDAANKVIGNPKAPSVVGHGAGGMVGAGLMMALEHGGIHVPLPALVGAGAAMFPYTKAGRAAGRTLLRQPGLAVPLAGVPMRRDPAVTRQNY